jgi:hypothetical protein
VRDHGVQVLIDQPLEAGSIADGRNTRSGPARAPALGEWMPAAERQGGGNESDVEEQRSGVQVISPLRRGL